MSNLKELPVNGQVNSNDDVVKWLRAVANNIEKGEYGNISSALLTVEHNFVPGEVFTVNTVVAGKSGLDNARCVGLLEIAKTKFINDYL